MGSCASHKPLYWKNLSVVLIRVTQCKELIMLQTQISRAVERFSILALLWKESRLVSKNQRCGALHRMQWASLVCRGPRGCTTVITSVLQVDSPDSWFPVSLYLMGNLWSYWLWMMGCFLLFNPTSPWTGGNRAGGNMEPFESPWADVNSTYKTFCWCQTIWCCMEAGESHTAGSQNNTSSS